MKNCLVALLSLACACVRLPHVDPLPRTEDVARRAITLVYSDCSEVDMLSPEYNSDVPGEADLAPTITWRDPMRASGVVISERHVLTAEHAVRCPIIPSVVVQLSDGRRIAMDVERDDVLFGRGRDIARLEVASAQNLGLYIAPPTLSVDVDNFNTYDTWCAETPHGRACGSPMWASATEAAFGAATRKGDSGSAVYDGHGRLVGLVVAGDGTTFTQVARVDARWLEGT